MKSSIRQIKSSDRIYLFLLILYLYYYSYRYILKYNTTYTSGTYSETPLAFKVLKYILAIILILFLLVHKGINIRICRENLTIFTIISFILVHFLVEFFIFGVTANVDLALTLFVVLFFIGNKWNLQMYNLIEKVFTVFFAYSVIYEAIQLILYFTIKRLPGLAWATGNFVLDVRFGGPWDSPNEFGLFLFFYFAFFINKYHGFRLFALLSIWGVMIVLTWSGTVAIAGTIALLIYFCQRKNMIRFLRKHLAIFAVLAVLIAFVLLLKGNEIIAIFLNVFEGKQGSIAAHFSSYDFGNMTVMTFLGLAPKDPQIEAGFPYLLYTGGVWLILMFVSLGLISIKRLLIMARFSKKFSPLFHGMAMHQLVFLLAMFNLSPQNVFTNMGVFSCFLMISAQYPHFVVDSPEFLSRSQCEARL